MSRENMHKMHTATDHSGVTHEMSYANFQDVVHLYGWTPGGVVGETDEAEDEAADPVADEAEAEVEIEDAEEAEADDNIDEAAADFDGMDKPALVAFLNANFPDATFDGRASRDTLAELAAELSA